jgi:asparagine synthase (glutamine-hydrolysing)
MCGINGQINDHRPIDPAVFNAKRDTLSHRGPDDASSWFSEDGRIALGFRRLSFLDLSVAGRQPMCNEESDIWLVFNGEIYNYLELREELRQLGHRFSSQTDAEVVLHGYEEWGHGVLSRLKGMFAFGIWDQKRKNLFLARDRFGIKPLYYGRLNGSFQFASEIKAMLHGETRRPALNRHAIGDYLSYRYIPSPDTIWENIHKLPPGHFLHLHMGENGSAEKRVAQYWRPQLGYQRIPVESAIEQVHSLLSQSVETHLRSDVPIGAFLSGGYDSSALVDYMTRQGCRPNTFSIGFEAWPQSEHLYAEMVARHLQVPHFSAIATKGELDLLDKLVYHYDEPIADISIIPTYMVSKLAAAHNKAVFSGEGADEIFGGYWWQKDIARYSRFSAINDGLLHRLMRRPSFFLEKYAEAMAMGRMNSANLRDYLHADTWEFINPQSEWFYNRHFRPFERPLKAFQYLDICTFMGELVLTKMDRASMAHSLEVRVPFLDHELVEFMLSLDQKVYFRPEETKFLLYANIRHSLPEAILQRPKQGFVGPDTYYMDIPWYAGQLQNGALIQQHILSREGLQKMINEQDHWCLWKFTVLEKWVRCWYE